MDAVDPIELLEARVLELERAIRENATTPKDIQQKQDVLDINYRILDTLYQTQFSRHRAPKLVQ